LPSSAVLSSLPSEIQRSEDWVGMAMPMAPLSCANTAVEAVRARAPAAKTVASVLIIFTSRLPLDGVQSVVWRWRDHFRSEHAPALHILASKYRPETQLDRHLAGACVCDWHDGLLTTAPAARALLGPHLDFRLIR